MESIGQYKIIKIVSKGNFKSKIFLAKKNDKNFIIKMISKRRLRDAFYQFKLLQQNLKIWRSIRCQYLMEIYEMFEDQDNKYVVCQYCNGQSLYIYQCKLPDRVFTLDKALEVISSLIKGLQVLKINGYSCQNFVQDNVLVHTNQNNQIFFKISDFHQGQIQDLNLRFMPPQFFKRQNQTNSYDIWAIGVILYYMLNDQFPFNSPTSRNVPWKEIVRYYESKYPFSYTYNIQRSRKKLIQNCFPQTEQLFMGIFQKDPQKRLTLNKLKQFSLFKKFFNQQAAPVVIMQHSIIYKKQFIEEEQNLQLRDLQKKYEQKKYEQKNDNPIFEKEIKELNFHIQHKNFIFGLSQQFKNQKNYLTDVLKVGLRYNLLKFYLLQLRKLYNQLVLKKVPNEFTKNLKWDQFFQSIQFQILLNELKVSLTEKQQIFLNAYVDCISYSNQLEQICHGFKDFLKPEVTQKKFDQFKTFYRKITSNAHKLLNTISKSGNYKQQKMLGDLRLRVIIAHIINRVFNKDDLLQNFQYYFEWKKKTDTLCTKNEFDFKSFNIWLIEQNSIRNLMKTANDIFKHYFN